MFQQLLFISVFGLLLTGVRCQISGDELIFNANEQQYVSLDSTTGFSTGSSPYTYTAWIKINTLGGTYTVLSIGPSSGGCSSLVTELALLVVQCASGSSSMCLQATYSCYGSAPASSSASVVPYSTWTHVAVLYDGTTFYAALNAVALDGFTITANTATQYAYIGIYGAPTGTSFSCFDGSISTLRAYSTHLSSGALSSDMSGSTSLSGLVSEYLHGSGVTTTGTTSTLIDDVGSNSGTLINGPIYDQLAMGTGGATGDPTFKGFRGQIYQIHGTSNSVYSIISLPSIQLTARFKFIGFVHRHHHKQAYRKHDSHHKHLLHRRHRHRHRHHSHEDIVLPHTKLFSHPGQYIHELGLKFVVSSCSSSSSCSCSEHRLRILGGDYGEGMLVFVDNDVRPLAPMINSSSSSFILHPDPHTVIFSSTVLQLTIVNSERFLNLDRVSLGDNVSSMQRSLSTKSYDECQYALNNNLNVSAHDVNHDDDDVDDGAVSYLIDGLLGVTAIPGRDAPKSGEEYEEGDNDIFGNTFKHNIYRPPVH